MGETDLGDFLAGTKLGTLVYYRNREGEGFGELKGSSLGWPIVNRPGYSDGLALNPRLTEVRAATRTERMAYECGLFVGRSLP